MTESSRLTCPSPKLNGTIVGRTLKKNNKLFLGGNKLQNCELSLNYYFTVEKK